MRSTLLRLAPAFVLSVLGVLATVYYFRQSVLLDLVYNESSALAYVKSVDGEHQTKREKSTLWSPAQEGDLLFAGDTVKSGEKGSLRIHLVGFPQAFEVEAQTQIKIEDGVRLRLEEGYLQSIGPFENSGTVIFAAKDEKPMTNRPMTITRDTDGNLEMIDPRQLDLSNELGIVFKNPVGQLETELNPDDPKPLSIVWENGQPGIRVAIEWGETRRSLSQRSIVESPKNTMDVMFPIGRHYWRWAIFKEGVPEPVWTSDTSILIVRGVFPPAAVSPVASAYVRLKTETEAVPLKWLPNARFKKMRIEISSDPKGEKSIGEESLTDKTEFSFRPPKLGTYYWRLSGYDEKRETWLRSKPHQFKVGLKDLDKVDIKWITENGSLIKYTTSTPTAALAWKVGGERMPKQFRVRISPFDEDPKNVTPQFTSAAGITAQVERSGKYRAFVEALNTEAEPIGQSSVLVFEVQQVPMLRAPAFASESNEALQANARGQINVEWRAVPGAKEYLLHLRDPAGKVQSFNVKKNSQLFTRLMPGRHELTVSAIDPNDRIGEKSQARTILVPTKNAVRALKIKKVEVK